MLWEPVPNIINHYTHSKNVFISENQKNDAKLCSKKRKEKKSKISVLANYG